jgi:hypothetical protein
VFRKTGSTDTVTGVTGTISQPGKTEEIRTGTGFREISSLEYFTDTQIEVDARANGFEDRNTYRAISKGSEGFCDTEIYLNPKSNTPSAAPTQDPGSSTPLCASPNTCAASCGTGQSEVSGRCNTSGWKCCTPAQATPVPTTAPGQTPGCVDIACKNTTQVWTSKKGTAKFKEKGCVEANASSDFGVERHCRVAPRTMTFNIRLEFDSQPYYTRYKMALCRYNNAIGWGDCETVGEASCSINRNASSNVCEARFVANGNYEKFAGSSWEVWMRGIAKDGDEMKWYGTGHWSSMVYDSVDRTIEYKD